MRIKCTDYRIAMDTDIYPHSKLKGQKTTPIYLSIYLLSIYLSIYLSIDLSISVCVRYQKIVRKKIQKIFGGV